MLILYYCHAAVVGFLAGAGCVFYLGPIGGIILGIIVGLCGVITAIKVEKDDNGKKD